MKLRRTGRGPAAAALVAIAGLILTGAASYAAWLHDQDMRAHDLARAGEVMAGAIEGTVNAAVTELRSAQALFEASNQVTSIEFSQFAIHQGASPGIAVIGFARVVPADEWAVFRATARLERPHYVILGVDRHPITSPPQGRHAVPVWYVHHRRIAPALLGVDLADDPERWSAIERALTSGGPAMTGRVSVLGGTGDLVEIYLPVHSRSAGGPGLGFAQLDLFYLVEAMVGSSEDAPSIHIADVTGSDPSAPENDSGHWSGRIDVVDRVWEISLTDESRLLLPTFTATVAASGVAITLLAAVLTAAVTSARERRHQLDDLLTRAREKDVFLATVAHELRTPLTSVVGAAALLVEQWNRLDEAEIEELLQAVHSKATDLSDLIEDFLVAGRLQAGAISYRSETVDVGDQIRRVLARINPLQDFQLDLGESGP